jgi:hypothetical protein
MWEGEDVWIIGGGPSVTKQFDIPKEVVKSVIEKTSPPSVYSPYMKYLHNKHVIGINVAFMIGDWMDMIFFGDNGFFLRFKEQLADYPGIRITCCPIMTSASCAWVKYIEKDADYPRGLTKNLSKVSWNGNSGAAAISVAVHAGAKRIFLLGFDMNLGEEVMQHWHDIYLRGKVDDDDKLRRVSSNFDRHLRSFAPIANDAKELGIEIINVNPKSEITDFPKVSLKQITG